MKRLLVTLILAVIFTGNTHTFAQDLSPERKQAVDSLALEKVRDLSKYIKLATCCEWAHLNKDN